jgi:hypothetical protein
LYHAALSCRVTNSAAFFGVTEQQQQQQHYKQFLKPLVMRMRLDLQRMIEELREMLLEELSAGFSRVFVTADCCYYFLEAYQQLTVSFR